jgi:hypothetical protein
MTDYRKKLSILLGLGSLFISMSLCASELFIATAAITNPDPLYTLVNSVDFHPKKNLFG